jgi:hypothetical protein
VGAVLSQDQRLRPVPCLVLAERHEWAKRQLDRRGIGYRELDNGFWTCDDPDALQRVRDTRIFFTGPRLEGQTFPARVGGVRASA